ncbi:hypothetical protein MKX03_008640, partial [Papaver bracteatum]
MEDVIDGEEIVEDSTNTELVTEFSENSSTPLEDDDSHELELIPPYFFVEVEEVETPVTIEFSKLNPVKVDKMMDSKMESSKDFITHLDLNCKNFLYLHLDFTHSIFDRGKWFDGS